MTAKQDTLNSLRGELKELRTQVDLLTRKIMDGGGKAVLLAFQGQRTAQGYHPSWRAAYSPHLCALLVQQRLPGVSERLGETLEVDEDPDIWVTVGAYDVGSYHDATLMAIHEATKAGYMATTLEALEALLADLEGATDDDN